MAKKKLLNEFQKCVLAAPNIPYKANWDTDIHPEKKSVNGYHDAARALRIEALESAKTLLQLAPFAKLKDDAGNQYSLSEIDPLIEYMKQHTDDNRFLKEISSANRKLVDPNVNQRPERILDYLRFQILVNTPQEAATLRNALLCDDPPTGITVTSYKDQFRKPCEEGGHAALKTHILVSSESQQMLAEMQISYSAMEEAHFPKAMRDIERRMKEASASCHEAGLSRHFIVSSACDEIFDRVQALRRYANLSILKKGGFLCMCDKDYNAEEIMNNAMETYNNGSHHANELMTHFSLPKTQKELLANIIH
ncbi:MAG: hypothetical protein AUJ12_00935 [Alphaproteobacteria bacterium CG1_02_46_17]|nr:MAG: hypothetical protein AUJ12_00935 [Alphaproteobacteria bacterium CG1_02_46_17]